MAPQGHALSGLYHRLSRRPRHDLIITTPEEFADALNRQFGGSIAHHASTHLVQIHPEHSARVGFSQGQKAILATLTALACFGLIDDGPLWLALCAVFSAAIAFGVGVRFAAFFASLPQPNTIDPPLREAHLPFYTLLVPLYREANIVASLVSHLKNLDYPVIAHEIFLLVEEEDTDTCAALFSQALPPHFRVIIAPPGKPRTKPRALNIGLFHARGELLVIYDAEDRPEPDQLRKAAAAFAAGGEKLACLQASLAIENARDSWLTRLFAIDYAGHFDVLLWGQPTRAFALRYEGQLVGYINRCAHVPVEMDWQPGEFLDHDKRWIVCSIHGASYSPTDGRCVGGPCGRGRLISVKVAELDGQACWYPSRDVRPAPSTASESTP
jgi:nitrite reductase/ring-hydroxylating ferredoxin subunit